MLMTNKILPVALVAALVGGTVGALVMRPGKTTETAQTTPLVKNSAADNGAQPTEVAKLDNGDQLLDKELTSETDNLSDDEKAAFRDGFLEGVRAARDTELTKSAAAAAPAASRVVYRDRTVRSRTASRQAPRRVYYDYGERRGRSFWQKHRDKLTVAMGTGAGAAIGGLAGGKKGALIGGLAGAGGSALYTYKLRKRDRRY